jgi:hypothetical protein
VKSLKPQRETKLQKGTRAIKLLHSLIGEDDSHAKVTAELAIPMHPYSWVKVIAFAKGMGWTVEAVIEELCERYIEQIEIDLRDEDKESEARKIATGLLGRN